MKTNISIFAYGDLGCYDKFDGSYPNEEDLKYTIDNSSDCESMENEELPFC